MPEPEPLRRGRLFHQMVQQGYVIGLDPTTGHARELRVINRAGRAGRADLVIMSDATPVPRVESGGFLVSVSPLAETIIVEIKATDWDRIVASRIRATVARHARQLYRYLDHALEKLDTGQCGLACMAILYPKPPADRAIRALIEEIFVDVHGIETQWYSEIGTPEIAELGEHHRGHAAAALAIQSPGLAIARDTRLPPRTRLDLLHGRKPTVADPVPPEIAATLERFESAVDDARRSHHWWMVEAQIADICCLSGLCQPCANESLAQTASQSFIARGGGPSTVAWHPDDKRVSDCRTLRTPTTFAAEWDSVESLDAFSERLLVERTIKAGYRGELTPLLRELRRRFSNYREEPNSFPPCCGGYGPLRLE